MHAERTLVRSSRPPLDDPDALKLERDWAEVFAEPARTSLTEALREWLPSRRWFRGKARSIESIVLREQIPIPTQGAESFLVLFEVRYASGEPETYVLPLACALGKKAAKMAAESSSMIVTSVSMGRRRKPGVLHDAIVSKEFCRALLEVTSRRHTVPGGAGELKAEPAGVLRQMRRDHELDAEPSVGKAEQSNSSVVYGSKVILKFFRRLDPGINPELEIERFLAKRQFPHSPALAGALEYRDQLGRNSTVSVVTSFIPGCHDAWEDTLAALKRFYRRVEALPEPVRTEPPPAGTSSSIVDNAGRLLEPAKLIGSYLKDARTLAQRTAALHLALGESSEDPAFRPEPWTRQGQEALFESLSAMTRRDFQLLRERAALLPQDLREGTEKVLPLESILLQRFHRLKEQPIDATRIRTHGDYHLGQVLHREEDFLIIDFEGEPAVSLEERRAKQSALRDVAGMIYSFFYAANAALREPSLEQFLPGNSPARAAWARYWSAWVSTAFLAAYLETARTGSFIPANETALKIILEAELLRKAVYELGYELNNRPDWLDIAFQVLLALLNDESI